MDEAKRLRAARKKYVGGKAAHLVLLPVGERLIAWVRHLHFRCPHVGEGPLEVWSGRQWREVRNLRALGYVLAQAGGLGVPPELNPVV